MPIAINSDSHCPSDFDNLRFGIGQARRGWLENRDALNTRTLRQLRQWLAGRKPDRSPRACDLRPLALLEHKPGLWPRRRDR
ncbi:hypothetical protein SBBP1_260024 [Burkholderiales bacterium]|nr:hypothetical protein SBBP1_260024 [Burkholderiales bacterium]